MLFMIFRDHGPENGPIGLALSGSSRGAHGAGAGGGCWIATQRAPPHRHDVRLSASH